ncbi:hypothetical protein RFI_01227 [Reticulomyxa filosa]|uniref:Uncharacterized protein n=1 Tax=Reticulomyxa filosa TaxID=46433 RepID=X6PCP0_RETFI|nr:hypothetical protein RFI_01227 [Reticulomyxa filosa]|eukprot:ETO35834.1 hypothetical protein RFI_01227 [Reticulomyxa filosa]
MLLLPFHLDVPSTMQSPYLSLSVQEFWGKRFNIVIQSLLKQFIFIPSMNSLYHWRSTHISLVYMCTYIQRKQPEKMIKALTKKTKYFNSKKTSFHISALATFICSALFHFYPLYLVIKDAPFFNDNTNRDFSSAVYITTGLSLMILYFFIQWACIIIEQKLKISTNASKAVIRLWVFGYILLLSPLFVVPLLLTLRLYHS